MLEEFKKFISKGSVVDLAVGVIVGGAFSSIVTSLVNDVIMPIIGVIIGGIDFTGLVLKVGDAQIKYGSFIQNVINFLIVAIVSLFFYVIGVLLILVSIISLIILGVNYFRHKKTTKGAFIYHIVIFSILLFNVFTFFPPLILESGFNLIAFLLMLPFAAIFILGIILNSYGISKLNKEKEEILQEN